MSRKLPAYFPGTPAILFTVTFKVAERNLTPFVSWTTPASPRRACSHQSALCFHLASFSGVTHLSYIGGLSILK